MIQERAICQKATRGWKIQALVPFLVLHGICCSCDHPWRTGSSSQGCQELVLEIVLPHIFSWKLLRVRWGGMTQMQMRIQALVKTGVYVEERRTGGAPTSNPPRGGNWIKSVLNLNLWSGSWRGFHKAWNQFLKGFKGERLCEGQIILRKRLEKRGRRAALRNGEPERIVPVEQNLLGRKTMQDWLLFVRRGKEEKNRSFFESPRGFISFWNQFFTT